MGSATDRLHTFLQVKEVPLKTRLFLRAASSRLRAALGKLTKMVQRNGMINLRSVLLLRLGMFLAFAGTPVFAQTNSPSDDSKVLSDTIAQMDAKAFAAFNAHDLDQLMSMFARELEFYHDKGGLTNYDQTREGFRKMFASMPDIHRELLPGSLKIYPIKDFGAIEVGTHRFCHKEQGKDECGEFPFVMIWKKERDTWTMSRVVSYGH